MIVPVYFKQNRGEPETLGNIRLGVDLLIQGPESAGEYLGEKAETAFKRPSLLLKEKLKSERTINDGKS